MVRSSFALMVGLLLLASGCGNSTRRPVRPGTDSGISPTSDSGVDTGTVHPPPTDGGTPVGDCSEAARWIYVVDSDGSLVRFEPDTLSFTRVGTLDCPAVSAETPFSMAVDRNANAWVLYSDGHVFSVSTSDAHCTATSFAPNQAGFEVFGMGFASNAAMSTDETLFVAGGPSSMIGSGANLGTINTSSLALTSIGGLPGWPELTGTGLGELWGFFPQTSPASVRQIDKASGSTSRNFPLSAIDTTLTQAWAFAFWGGRFYIFIQAFLDTSTNVRRLDPTDGSVTEVVHDSGFRIVGAGVSTCAPVELI